MLSVEQINKLQEENAVLQAYKDVNEDFKTAWEELKAENDRLKKDIRTEKIYSSQIEELEESLNHLKQENERLKEKFEIESLTDKTTGETIYRSNVINKLKELLELRIEDLCESCGASSIMPMPCTVYKHALQEIKKICKNSHTSASEDYYRTADKILQEINEVIGAEE